PIRNLPERKRRMHVGRGEKPYLYTIASDREVSLVRKRWKSEISGREFIDNLQRIEILDEEVPTDEENQNVVSESQ
ncbi:MAG: hypothetical protein ACP5PS_07840, partial [Bacteroidales bacterium]